MKLFPRVLSDLMKSRSQADVARLSGLSQSMISHYAAGTRGITADSLSELIRAFPERSDQVRLGTAHLRDETPEDLKELIRIEFVTDAVNQEQAPYGQSIESAFELLKNRAKDNPDVRELIVILERVFR